MENTSLTDMLDLAQQLGIHGLMFQHVMLCPTRTWLHYHRVDCAHLNRHMQYGIWVHKTAYSGSLDHLISFGIRPDRVDWNENTISEIKSSRFSGEASQMQLLFYMAVLIEATQNKWVGLLRTPKTRRIIHLEWDDAAEEKILDAFNRIQQIIIKPIPPQMTEKGICGGCSYRLLCWGLSTEDDG